MKLFRAFIVLIIISFLTISAESVYAQYENTSGEKKEGNVNRRPKPKKPKKWFVGGMLGAGFSSYNSYVEVSPVVGYEPIQNLQVAMRLTYIYNSTYRQTGANPYTETKVNLNHFGASFLARYIIFKGIFVQTEYEMLSYDDKYFVADVTSPNGYRQVEERIPINTLFLGGGFYQRFGNGYASFAILFPIAENYESFYSNYVIRMSFGGFF